MTNNYDALIRSIDKKANLIFAKKKKTTAELEAWVLLLRAKRFFSRELPLMKSRKLP